MAGSYTGGVSGNSLEHYGRLGMKWYQHIYGEADGRAKYVARYKEKESAYLKRQAGKERDRQAKFLERDKARGDMDEYEYRKNLIEYAKEITKRELKVIENMTIEDILEESDLVNARSRKAVAEDLKSMLIPFSKAKPQPFSSSKQIQREQLHRGQATDEWHQERDKTKH